jgi:arylsulfatase A-like enzyme
MAATPQQVSMQTRTVKANCLLRAILFLVCLGALARPAAAIEELDPPNIILIMADDLGYGDLSCYGQKSFTTPNIDRLAQEGMRFTDYYAGSTVCAPSRCVLMTGLHTGHCLVRGNARVPLRDEDVTMPEVLQKAGYRTGLFGKWGLGEEGSSGYPTKQGFDEFFGYVNQHHAHNYYPTFLLKAEERFPLKNVVPNEDANGGGKATERREYSHDLIMREGLDFIARQKGEQPFFLYLALTIPHANNEAGKDGMEVPDLGEFADKDWPAPRQGHAAMITHMDRDIGRLLEQLKKQGLDKRTLILFTSDNGPHNEGGYQTEMNDSNGKLRGSKRDLYEGGIRVPLIAWWPGKIAAGKTSAHVAAHQDLLPTLAQFGSGSKHVRAEIDGISFQPTLFEKGEQIEHDYLYWAFYERGGAQAARAGDWKLVEQPKGTKPQLFDMRIDVSEAKDVAGEHPEVVARLNGLMQRSLTPSETWKFTK